jgi:outer membrane protein assembly factor BamB
VYPEDRPTAAELISILTSDLIPTPEPGWYETTSTAPLGVVLDVPRTGRFSRRRLLAAAGGAGLMALGAGAWFARFDRTADRPASVTTSLQPGTVLWLATSGADPTAGGSGATRIIPEGQQRIVAARPTQVYAQTVAGRRLWNHPLPARFVDVHAWQGAVLVADATRLWLLDPASGRQRFTVDIADSLKIKGTIEHVVSSAERAYVNTHTAIVALDDQGRLVWHQAAGSPLAADTTSLLTHDRSGDTVRVGLRDAATGQQRWVTRYRVPTRPPAGPPPGPPPADGPPGGPPLVDDAWMRTEAHIAAGFVAVRDGQDLRVLRLQDGGTVWKRTWPTPIAAIAVAGDLLLVGADKLNALTLATGAQAWQSPLRGARMGISADGHTIAVAAERTITVLDPAGRPQWETDLPAPVTAAVPDRVTLDQHTMFVTFKPLDQHVQPLSVDVVAVALRDA